MRPLRVRRSQGVAGFTVIELLITSFLAIVVMYGASFLYLHYYRAMGRGKDKLRLQEDATYATEFLVRQIRQADSVSTSNSANPRLSTWLRGTKTADVQVSPSVNGKTYLQASTSGGGFVNVVPTPFQSLQFIQTGGIKAGTVVQFSLGLADTSGNKVVTAASAGIRNPRWIN